MRTNIKKHNNKILFLAILCVAMAVFFFIKALMTV